MLAVVSRQLPVKNIFKFNNDKLHTTNCILKVCIFAPIKYYDDTCNAQGTF